MENFNETLSEILSMKRLLASLVVVALGFVCWGLLRRLIRHTLALLERRGRKINNPDGIQRAGKYIVIAAFGAELLNVFGVDLSSLLAGLGIAGVVVGFAVQDVLKDLTMGVNIMADKYFSVGDIVSIGSIRNARVVSFNIKTTRLEDLDSGNIITIANRNISEATVLSDWQDVEIPAPYEISASRMRDLCWKLCERVENAEYVKSCTFLGTQELGESAVYYKLRIIGLPDKKRAIRRSVLECMQDLYEEEGISVPYPHMNITQM